MQELARQYTPEAIEALVQALGQPRERVAAASVLLDRGYGKPMQPITGKDGGPIEVVVDDARIPLHDYLAEFVITSEAAKLAESETKH